MQRFAISDLFAVRNEEFMVDISGGLKGVHLPDGSISGVSATEIINDLKYIAHNVSDNKERQKYFDSYAGNRRVRVSLAAQILSLLDAFIFPDSLDASLPFITSSLSFVDCSLRAEQYQISSML